MAIKATSNFNIKSNDIETEDYKTNSKKANTLFPSHSQGK